MSTSKNDTEVHTIDDDDDDEEGSPDEYTVEVIRNKRKNPKTGATEYFIKWEGYAENENTWEPIDNLSCPEKIVEYEQKEIGKRKRRGIKEKSDKSASVNKRQKRATDSQQDPENSFEENVLLVENGSDTETLSSESSTNQKNGKSTTTHEGPIPQLKGFDRKLGIEKIVGSCTDDKEKLWFFIKWKGLGELELVEVDDIEAHAPKQLCAWYRERLYHSIKVQNENNNPTTTAEV